MVSGRVLFYVLSCAAATVLVLYISFSDQTGNVADVNIVHARRQAIIENPDECKLPSRGFKGWNQGLVTVLKPEIPRNCTKLFATDETEMLRVKDAKEVWKSRLSDEDFLKMSTNCSWLQEEFSNNLYNTAVERDFPLAFNFIIHKYPQQVVRLIKVLYRPQNVFCIHIDKKSPNHFKDVFKNLAKCFDNFMIASKLEDVRWGKYTNMEAQMNCFTDLVKKRPSLPEHQRWKYAIDLCGTELPLMTNHEMVTILKELKGSSLLKPGKVKPNSRSSWERIRLPLPYNLTFYKGSGYNALSYKFVSFLVEDPMGIAVHEYFKNARVPEEHFYASLFMHPGVPGGYNPDLEGKYFEISKAIWCYTQATINTCRGKVVHSVCITSSGDLAQLTQHSKGSFFHNKYDANLDHTVMDCMEERIVQRNLLEYKEECQT